MNRAIVTVLTAALLASAACEKESADVANEASGRTQRAAVIRAVPCLDVGGWQVTDSAVGPIRLGAEAATVIHLCPGTIDSTVHEQDMETEYTNRVLFVPVGSRDTIRVTIDAADQGVDAISLRSGPFLTADSLRIGSPITQWRGIPGVKVLYGDHSDDGALVLPNHCGLIFGISDRGLAPTDRVADARVLATWPDSIRITEIIVSPCGEPRR